MSDRLPGVQAPFEEAAEIETEPGNFDAAERLMLNASELSRRLDGSGSPIVNEYYGKGDAP